MDERIILHCDLDNFFASVECVFRPELKNVPMIVCGNESERHGVVLAKNQLAKKAGIKTAETVWQARKKCPGLVTVPPQMAKYREFSVKAREIYLRYTDLVEAFSIDECWLDVTGSTRLFGNGEQIAKRIQTDMKNELGLTVSVGVSFNKYFAKLASDVNKPDGIFIVGADDFKEKLYKRPATELMGVGESTRAKLSSVGIFTIGDLASASEALMKKLLGKHGEGLWKAANGLECEPVLRYGDAPRPKSIGRSTTLSEDTTDLSYLRSVLAELSDDISSSLRREKLFAASVQIQIKDNLFKVSQYQKHLSKPTRIADELLKAGIELINDNDAIKNPVRLIGITAGDLTDEAVGVQLSFDVDESHSEKMEELGVRVDGLREKYGKSVIKRASQI
ncbi:MAG: DNA polymerase IV [Clostridia bacterium]|nr:DNA polymerase IV [Clostridia bacterium]